MGEKSGPQGCLRAVARRVARVGIVGGDRDFDYLYVLGPRISNLMPTLLEELDHSSGFVLYPPQVLAQEALSTLPCRSARC